MKRSIEELKASVPGAKTESNVDTSMDLPGPPAFKRQSTHTPTAATPTAAPVVPLPDVAPEKAPCSNEAIVYQAATIKFENIFVGKMTKMPSGQVLVPLHPSAGNDNPVIIQFGLTGGYIAKFPIQKNKHGKYNLTWNLSNSDDMEYDNMHAFQNALIEYAVAHKTEWFPPGLGKKVCSDDSVREKFTGFIIKEKEVKCEKHRDANGEKIPIMNEDGEYDRWSGKMSTNLPFNKHTDKLPSTCKIVDSNNRNIDIRIVPGKKYQRISVQVPNLWFMQTGNWGIISTVKNVQTAFDPYEASGREVPFAP